MTEKEAEYNLFKNKTYTKNPIYFINQDISIVKDIIKKFISN